jgi:uncharacterized phiE125 gp8 family phage protein
MMADLIETTVTTGMIPRLARIDEPVIVEEPISLEQAKKHLRLEGVLDDEDEQIQRMIVSARRLAEGKLNRTITQREIVATFDGWGCKMRLKKPPFIEIIGVSYLDADGVSQDMAAESFYVLDGHEPAEVAFVGGSPLPSLAARRGVITVRYLAGYPAGEVPEDIISWMLMQIGSLYTYRESVIAGVSVAPLPEMYERMFLQPYMVYE